VTDEAIALLAPRIGTRAACAASGVPQATWYRRHRASPVPPRDRVQPRALAAGVLTAAYLAHPERFVRKPPEPPQLPAASWINPPGKKEAAAQ
jgi:hypothetical protein